MPGSTPPTNQLDWLISTTAMSCYLSPRRRGTCSSRSAGASGHSISYIRCSDDGAISSPPAPYHLAGGARRIRILGRFLARIGSRAKSLPASIFIRGGRTPAAKIEHPVQRGNSNGHLGRLPSLGARAQRSPITHL